MQPSNIPNGNNTAIGFLLRVNKVKSVSLKLWHGGVTIQRHTATQSASVPKAGHNLYKHAFLEILSKYITVMVASKKYVQLINNKNIYSQFNSGGSN